MAGIFIFSENFELAYEILGKGSELADKLNMKLNVVIIGNKIKNKAREFFNYGADKVYVCDNEKLKDFYVEQYSKVFVDIAKKENPEIILIGSTKKGKEFASRVATKLETGLIPDCIDIQLNPENDVLFKRVVLGGNAIATEICKTAPKIATIPMRTFEKIELKKESKIIDIDIGIEEPRTKIIETQKIEKVGKNIEEANVIVAGGRGVEKKEDFKILDELAEVLNGQVGYTRPLVEDRKWFSEWIGLSGHNVKPNLYVAIGIAGVIQHTAGIRDSKIIVAINKDEEAPIFEYADYKVVGDLYEIVPELTENFKKLLR